MSTPPTAAPRSGAGADRAFELVTAGAAWLVLILLGSIAASMAWGGRLAFETFGWEFIVSREWDAIIQASQPSCTHEAGIGRL